MNWSASKTDLLFACGYSFRSDVRAGFEPVSESSTVGNELHAAIEAVLLGNEPATHAAAATGVALWLSTWVASRDNLRVEAAIAWDPSSGTARLLGRGRGAYGSSHEHELRGTADCMQFRDGVLDVWDWKSGEFGAAKARMQLRTLAVMGAALFGEVYTVRTFSVLVDPSGHDAPRTVLTEQLGPLELAEHASALRDALSRVANSDPVLGEHCSDCFCSQRGSCPARAALVESMTASANLVQVGRNPLTAPLQSAADAAALIELLPHVESYIKTRKAEAQEYVDKHCDGEVRLSETHVYRKTQSSRKSIRGEEAFNLAKKLGAAPEDLAACMSTTRFDRWTKLKKGA